MYLTARLLNTQQQLNQCHDTVQYPAGHPSPANQTRAYQTGGEANYQIFRSSRYRIYYSLHRTHVRNWDFKTRAIRDQLGQTAGALCTVQYPRYTPHLQLNVQFRATKQAPPLSTLPTHTFTFHPFRNFRPKY